MTNSQPGQWPNHGSISDVLKKGSPEGLQSALGNFSGLQDLSLSVEPKEGRGVRE